ncbi:MAG: gluconate 2-dehydrogenase subunit 3 family protein [Erythrobacter sp.]|nr:MAG: gluconate 2-dehydrogenase subunit 3 family protein [Erythrobacter sp.]
MSIESMANMNRRSLMGRALLLLGASAAASACQSMDAFALQPEPVGTGPLTAQQMAVLTAMAGQIIPQTDTPGAVEAGVPERLEGMLSTWASPETRAGFERVLADVDALPEDGRSFAAVSPQEQERLLRAHDAQAMQPSGPVRYNYTTPVSTPTDPVYGRLKDLIVTLYYLSEAAMTQEIIYTHVPGAWQPSTPVTPDTRPLAGASL